jgi:branched-chain amino acid transport system permease protein
VVLGGALLTLLCYIGIGAFLRRFYRVSVMTHFLFYLFGTILCFAITVSYLAQPLGAITGTVLSALPKEISRQVVFFCALIGGASIAGIASYLFGIPVLELGSDYFGISTLGFTIIVKVLLDNTDTILPFPEMQGARGMTVPKLTTWPWVFFSLLVVVMVMRNLLHSSTGRAIISVREDERAAQLVGVNVANAKLLAFVVGTCSPGWLASAARPRCCIPTPPILQLHQIFDPLIVVVFGGWQYDWHAVHRLRMDYFVGRRPA